MTSLSQVISSATKSTRSAPSRINEIDGLRGISLTLVVVFHLFGHGRVSGGVDVFLTVSGFLLIMSLGRSILDGRPLGILARWGRTFSRLAPSAALVLIAVTIGCYIVFAPWTRSQTLLEVISAAIYVENWQLIATQLEYGAAGPDTSPLQHFWSLSVQAQFFLLFPLIPLIIVSALRHRRHQTIIFWTTVCVLVVLSFSYACIENAQNAPRAYFDTFARFWELGLGGLIAGLHISGFTLPRQLKVAAGWAGLLMIIMSGFVFDGGTSYPGPRALLPVGGAVLVLLATAGGRGSPSVILTSRPLVFLDKISYGLYLWHWPVLISFLSIKQRDTIGWKGAIVVLSITIALTLATRWVVEPITRGALRRGPKVAFTLAVASIVCAALPATVIHTTQTNQTNDYAHLDACAGAASLDLELPECADYGFNTTPYPTLDMLWMEDANREECWSGYEETSLNVCALGNNNDPEKKILAVGDSHNNVWLDVYEEIARSHDWQIDAAARPGCQWIRPEVPVLGQSDEGATGCRVWRSKVNDLVSTGGYDAIIVAASSKSVFNSDTAGLSDIQYHTNAITDAWSHRTSIDVPILFIRDNPIFTDKAFDCIKDPAAVRAGHCEVSRREALLETGYLDAVKQTENAHYVDLSNYQCGENYCPMVVGGIITTLDRSHLTKSFAWTLLPYLDREITALLT